MAMNAEDLDRLINEAASTTEEIDGEIAAGIRETERELWKDCQQPTNI